MALFDNFVQFKGEVESYLNRCESVFREVGENVAANNVKGLISVINDQRYNITIIGSLNRGKSTLLNTLMERQDDNISPISADVCTSAIIKYNDIELSQPKLEKESAVIHFNPDKDGNIQKPVTIPLSGLKGYVKEEQNPGNRKGVKSVEVYGNFPAWSKAVTIVDSPGQNSVYNHHDELLTSFLPYTDAIIFIVAANLPLDGGDLGLLKELSDKQKKKLFFVLTKVDTIPASDFEDVKTHVIGKITEQGLDCNKLYTVSAKPVFEALKVGKKGAELDALKEKHGILELERDLEEFIVHESENTKWMVDRIKDILQQAAEVSCGYIEQWEKVLQAKDYDIAALQADKETLINANKELKKNTDEALRKFSRDWDKVVSSFHRRFSSKSDKVESKIINNLEKSGFLATIYKSFRLKKEVSSAVDSESQPLIIELEEKLEPVIKELTSELDEALSISVKKTNGKDAQLVLGSLAAGGAMAGTVYLGVDATIKAFSAAGESFDNFLNATSEAMEADGAAKARGGWEKGWDAVAGGELPQRAIQTAIEAKTDLITFIVDGAKAIATGGISIGVSLLARMGLKQGILSFQEARIPEIVQKVMTDTEESVLKNLNIYKDGLVEECRKNISYMTEDNENRLNEVIELLSSNDPEERKQIEMKVEKVRELIPAKAAVDRQLVALER